MEVEIGTKTFDKCIESSSCKEVLYLAALINLKTVLEMLYFINQQSPAPTAANICNCPRPIKTHYINANDTESLMHAFNALQIMSAMVNTLFWACMENYLCPKTNSKFASQYGLIIMTFDQCIFYEYWWGSNWILYIRNVYACCAGLYLSVGIDGSLNVS